MHGSMNIKFPPPQKKKLHGVRSDDLGGPAKQRLICGRASDPALGQIVAEVAADEVVVQINLENFSMWVAC